MDNGTSEQNSVRHWVRYKKPLIIIFICFYLFVQVIAILPKPDAQKLVLPPIWQAIQFIALFHHYVVFAPPRKYNIYLEANVKLNDGQIIVWKYPRLEHLSFFEKMPKIYFRKFFNEFAHYDANSMLWPDLALYVAKQVRSETGKQPVEVTLIRYRADVPPPSGDPLPGSPTAYHAEQFYSRAITGGDLQ